MNARELLRGWIDRHGPIGGLAAERAIRAMGLALFVHGELAVSDVDVIVSEKLRRGELAKENRRQA